MVKFCVMLCTVKSPVFCPGIISDFPQVSHEFQPGFAVWQQGQSLSGQGTGTQGENKQWWVTISAKGEWGGLWENSCMATGWVEGVVAALCMELLLRMVERGPGQDLALPSGLSALVRGWCFCLSSRDWRGKVSGKPSWDSQKDLENPDSPAEIAWRWVRMLSKTKQKEANEELSKTKQEMNKNSPERLIHHKSCSSVKHECFASLNHLLRPFPSQIWRPGLLTQCPWG